jgi:DNA-binding response OmpR family regulator
MVGQLRNADVNLMILDLRLGQGDGLDLLRDVHEVAFDRRVDAQILRLRRKLEQDQARFSALPSLRIKASKLEPNVLAA